MERPLSPAEEDYLKAIYTLQQETGRATTQAIASHLGVKPPSVTAMVKHLAEDLGEPYLRHTPYHGVELTPRGETVALEMLRHHRLIELYLSQQLDVPWDRLHEEAERLEHVLSEDLEERIAAKLGQPTRDPHGDPIPSREGAMNAVDDVPLSTLEIGTPGTVVRVPDEPALLHYLAGLGLIPGALVTVEAVAPFGDVLTLRVDGEQCAVGGEVVRRVLVSPAAVLEEGPHEPTGAAR